MVFCHIIGITMRKPMKIDRTFPFSITQSKTINDATGVAFIIVIIDEIKASRTVNLLHSIARTKPSTQPSRKPRTTLIVVRSTTR
jgi:hypothetical protein